MRRVSLVSEICGCPNCPTASHVVARFSIPQAESSDDQEKTTHGDCSAAAEKKKTALTKNRFLQQMEDSQVVGQYSPFCSA